MSEDRAPSTRVVSSIVVEPQQGGHERVRVWNRGGLAGELVVQAGDGQLVADLLLASDFSPAIHVLREGLPLCGFSAKVPGEWPEGHVWVGEEEVSQATCHPCIERVRATQTGSAAGDKP